MNYCLVYMLLKRKSLFIMLECDNNLIYYMNEY